MGTIDAFQTVVSSLEFTFKVNFSEPVWLSDDRIIVPVRPTCIVAQLSEEAVMRINARALVLAMEAEMVSSTKGIETHLQFIPEACVMLELPS